MSRDDTPPGTRLSEKTRISLSVGAMWALISALVVTVAGGAMWVTHVNDKLEAACQKLDELDHDVQRLMRERERVTIEADSSANHP